MSSIIIIIIIVGSSSSSSSGSSGSSGSSSSSSIISMFIVKLFVLRVCLSALVLGYYRRGGAQAVQGQKLE